MKSVIKRVGLVAGLGVVFYVGALGHFYWKWQLTHADLPARLEQAGEQVLYRPDYGSLAAKVDRLLITRLLEWAVPSISVVFAVDDELVWAGTRGFADIENEVPAGINSRYRAGSIAKALTTMAMARMVQRQEFDVDLPIQNYLPSYPEFDKPITARLLASHSAGVRHYRADVLMWPPHEFFIDEQFDRVGDALEVFRDDDLLFSPGDNFSYSSYGFNLLSAVMEAAAGVDYLTLMRTEVFEPAGMNHTQPDLFGRQAQNRVRFYNTDAGRYGEAYPVNLSVKWAGGGFLSTPSDLVRAGILVLDNDYLNGASRELIFTPIARVAGGDDPDGYALGWRSHLREDIGPDGEKIHVVSHGGGSIGGLSYLMILADKGMAVAVQTNTSSGGEPGAAVQALAEEVMGMVLEHVRNIRRIADEEDQG